MAVVPSATPVGPEAGLPCLPAETFLALAMLARDEVTPVVLLDGGSTVGAQLHDPPRQQPAKLLLAGLVFRLPSGILRTSVAIMLLAVALEADIPFARRALEQPVFQDLLICELIPVIAVRSWALPQGKARDGAEVEGLDIRVRPPALLAQSTADQPAGDGVLARGAVQHLLLRQRLL